MKVNSMTLYMSFELVLLFCVIYIYYEIVEDATKLALDRPLWRLLSASGATR